MKKHSLTHSIFLAVALTLLSLPARVSAQITNPSIGGALGGEGDEALQAAESGATFVNYFVYLWNAVMVVGGLIVLFFFIQAGIEWITAGGDSAKITKARERMLQSTIGLFILVFSFVIINFISALLFGGDFNILNLTLPTPNEAARGSGR